MDEQRLTNDEAEAIAQEVAEAVPAIRKFARLPKADKVKVMRHVLDKQIGTDATAALKSIPGLTPEITEAVTDPMLDLMAKMLIAWWAGPED